MKIREGGTQQREGSQGASTGATVAIAAMETAGVPRGEGELHFVHGDSPSVRVRMFCDTGLGGRCFAELVIVEAGVERAVVDAASPEELRALLPPAVRAFSLAARQRLRFPARPIP
jgi:hypothetical protein